MSAEPRINHKQLSSMDSYDAYLNLRTSLFHFGCFPFQLEDESEMETLATEVLKQHTINASVRSSPEYSQIVVPEQELEHALQEIYEQIPAGLELDDVLMQNGLTHLTLRDAVALDLRVASALNHVAEQQPEVSDMDAELFYRLHSERRVVPERRTVRHILVTINDQFAENRREAALFRIRKVRRELIKKPFKFEKFARSTSECPTALEGGLLGTFTSGQLYPEIDEVLLGMVEGEISEVVESTLGFHVLKCEAISPGREIPFEDVREKIKSALRQRNQRDAQRRWLQQRMKSVADN